MEKVRIQDNLYEAVNGEWLATAIIPDDRPTTGGFSVLDQEVEELMMKEFKEFSLGNLKTVIKEMDYAISLYKKVLDTNRRNSDGIKPALPLLDKIKNVKNVNELNLIAKDLLLSNVNLPIQMGVDVDMKDATKNSFFILGPNIILPDTTYYNDDATYNQLIGLYSQMVVNALEKTNLTKEEQELFLADAVKFDKLVSKSVKSSVEWADYVNNYNPMPLEEVIELVKPFDIEGLLASLYGNNKPDTIIVFDPRAIKEFNNYFNEEHFNLYKHWAYINCLLSASKALSLELASNAGSFRRALVGIDKEPELDKQAYQIASKYYSEPIGLYYGRKYFGEEAKADVISLVKKIIETYKERMVKNTFIEDNTKEKAIKKLSTIVIKMGYPDKIDDFYSKLVIDEKDSLYEATYKLNKAMILHNLEDLLKPVDRTKWVMPGHMVNACYNPSSNDITFPAAILQKPFYSINQSVSENLGGIGAVIAHEISHAFDNNGAHFDENGNISFQEEGIIGEQYNMAIAAHNSGGIVIVEVKDIKEANSFRARDVLIHSSYVDYVVVNKPDESLGEYNIPHYKPEITGDKRIKLEDIEIRPLDERKVCGRRSAMELHKGFVINLGVGMPDSVANAAAEEGISEDIYLSVESGPTGGVPIGGVVFGASFDKNFNFFQ